jgi:hypothetical protein
MFAARTAPTGPSNGSPASIVASDAALIDGMSYGWAMSTDRTVITMWTSSRKPSANDGRIGRSVSRAVRMAVSDGRPSRRKNPPGILPAAYMRSSTSTVSGKKSIPSRGLLLVEAPSTCVSPIVTTAAPPACLASLPASNVTSVPPMFRVALMGSIWSFLLVMASCCGSASAPGAGREVGQLSVVGHRAPGSRGSGDSLLITDPHALPASCLGSGFGPDRPPDAKKGGHRRPRLLRYLRSPSFAMRAR